VHRVNGSVAVGGSPARFKSKLTETPTMTLAANRRQLLKFSLLAALPPVSALSSLSVEAAAASAPQDFDAFLGRWQVRHRRLKRRLVASSEWEEFDGTTHWQSILGGAANFNDSIVYRSTGTYRSMGLRAFDASTQTWSDWYLDGRKPSQVTIDGTGRFVDGVGIFLADDTFEGKPVKVRGRFTPLTPDTMQWEQAYSPDGEKTWETNYVMHCRRIAP
jgi:hypothetical protein